jgi:hypothetical protein
MPGGRNISAAGPLFLDALPTKRKTLGRGKGFKRRGNKQERKIVPKLVLFYNTEAIIDAKRNSNS